MKKLAIYLLLVLLTSFLFQNAVAQEKKDTTLYAKWRISVSITPAVVFNIGKKYMTQTYYDPGYYYNGYSFYINVREKSQWGYQFSLELVSRSFLNNKFAFRMGLGLDKYYYTGIATSVTSTNISMYPNPPIFLYDTCINCRKYYFQDYFLNFSVLPQFNINDSKRVVFYYFIGPSLDMLLKEVSDREENEWSDKSKYFTAFGVTGLGSTIKIVNGFYLDTQLRFTYQIFVTPAGRCLASAGIRLGFIF